jgi:hypothetical protein
MSSEVFDVTGSHLLTVSPVIWPSNPMFFRADVLANGSSIDLSLQPLAFDTREPVGDPWELSGLPIEADGSFVGDFGARDLPIETYPIVDIEGSIDIESFVLTGKTTSTDGLCGGLGGYAQFLTPSAADRISLDGSSFGAVRIEGDTLPEPVSSCP